MVDLSIVMLVYQRVVPFLPGHLKIAKDVPQLSPEGAPPQDGGESMDRFVSWRVVLSMNSGDLEW